MEEQSDGQARQQRERRRIATIAEAFEHDDPILDPLGDRLHYPGEAQYEAWREEYRRKHAEPRP